MPLSNEERLAWILRAVEQDPEHATLLLDLSGRTRWGNATACRLLGVPPDAFDDGDLHRFFTPEDRALGVPDVEFAIARSDGPAEDDRWQRRADDSRVWVNGVLFALKDDNGAPLGFVKVLRNRMDARLQLDTIRNQLASTRDTLAARDVSLLEAAHELRHPLSSIGFGCELLRGRTDDADVLETLDSIERQVATLSRLVDGLARTLEADETTAATPRPVLPINRILRDAVADMRGVIEHRGHRLDMLLTSDALCVAGDAGRLRQVFANLLDNAAKYTPPGGHLWVKATIEGHECVARVEDNGVGLAPEQMAHVFGMFARAEPTGATPGSGIGLAVVKAIVEEHGGSVQVESEGRGCGAKFTVRLPVAATIA